jgi:hypothetical protein
MMFSFAAIKLAMSLWFKSASFDSFKKPLLIFLAVGAMALYHWHAVSSAESAGFLRGGDACRAKVLVEKARDVERAQAKYAAELKLRKEVDDETEKLSKQSRDKVDLDNRTFFGDRVRNVIAKRPAVPAGIGSGAQAQAERGQYSSPGGGGGSDARALDPASEVNSGIGLEPNLELTRAKADLEAALVAAKDYRQAALDCASESGINGRQLEKIERGAVN